LPAIITFKWYKIDVNVYNPRPYFIVGDGVPYCYCREQFTENVNFYIHEYQDGLKMITSFYIINLTRVYGVS